MKLADRMGRLGTETAFDVLVRARALEAKGQSIVHLEIGEPDFDTPAYIVDAGVKAMKNGKYHHYGPSVGQLGLRTAIAEDVAKSHGVPVDPSEVVVTPGAKPIIFFTILALADKGDEILYPNPGFPIYESMINFVGAKPVPVALREDKNWALDVDQLEKSISQKTKLLIINSPHNPTGGIIPEQDIKRIAALAKKHDFWILSDEVYSRIIYANAYHSVYSLPGMKERTILLDGYSKIYAMTGWRLGYGVMPPELVPHVAKLQTNSTSCTATFTQIAGIEAMKGDQTPSAKMVDEFRRRRDLIVKGLNEIPGFSCKTPDGAFYVFPNVKKVNCPAKKLADMILEEGGVAGLSGTAFGAWGEGYLRFSYANSQENIAEALRRIKKLIVDKKLA